MENKQNQHKTTQNYQNKTKQNKQNTLIKQTHGENKQNTQMKQNKQNTYMVNILPNDKLGKACALQGHYVIVGIDEAGGNV